MRRARNSQLRTLRQCPFAYEQQYLSGLPGAPSPILDGGRNIHAAAQLLVRRIVEGGPIDVHEIAFRTVRGGPSEYADALKVLIRMQEAIGVEFDIVAKDVIGLEETLTMPVTLYNGSVVEFFGTPDLVERIGKGACRITDWKTHHVVETADEFSIDWQLKRYALLVHAAFPSMKVFKLVKRFVRFSNAFHEITITVDDFPTVRSALVSELSAEQEIIDVGVFEATPGEWCGPCDRHHVCPKAQELLAVGFTDLAITSDEHAARIAGEAHVFECAATAHKNRLKNYLGGAHPAGRITVPLPGGGEYGFIPTSHREVPLVQLQTALLEDGIEAPDELAKTDLTTLDRLLKKLPEATVQKIEGLTVRWQTSQMRFRSGAATKKATVNKPTAAAGVPTELF